jgi:hypothetical protein
MHSMHARIGSVAVALALLAPLGCKEREQKRDDKGRANVDVQTPAGGVSVDVQYPKNRDHDKDHDHR